MRKLLAKTTMAVLLAAPLAPAAWAGPVLNAAVTDLRLRTIDLNPADAVAAGYELTSQGGNYVNSITVGPKVVRNEHALVPGGAFDDAIAEGPFTSTLVGTAGIGDVSARLALDDTQATSHDSYMSSTYTYTAQLTLSAGTVLILSGELLQQFAPAGMYEYAPVSSAFSASLTRTDGNDSYTSLFAPELRQGGWDGGTTGGWDRLSPFALTLTNAGDTSATVDLKLTLSSSLRDIAPMSLVPEPSTWLMLGAGLLLLGTAARRRR